MVERAGPDWTAAERGVLRKLSSPVSVQRFLDEGLVYNKETKGETLRSPRRVLRDRTAHCAEGALFAAAAFRWHGRAARILLLRAVRDDDHVLALFREKGETGAWGAVAKSNYSGLRFREPVYRSIRELTMSYFEHYYNLQDEKTLRAHSRPFDLSRFDRRGWQTAEDELWDLSDALASARLIPILSPSQTRVLSRVDPRSSQAGLVGAVKAPPFRAC